MEFKEAMRIWKRMCESIEDGSCSGCPLKEVSDGICRIWAGGHPAPAEAILAKWAEEHPEKTIADDFFERCPNATKDDMKIPYVCAKHVGYSAPTYCERIPQRCAECWRRPLEEVEG
jgi:hypothetical protein